MNPSNKTIRLGICMAGAVSAGAYTAGVVDYLIETLERWQQKKQSIREKLDRGEALSAEELLVPMHDVVIEVLSGASAGGMTAAVLSYSFHDQTYINRRNGGLIPENYSVPQGDDVPSKLYNAWINMADEGEETTFRKLMDTSDVTSLNQMRSLLNSQPIDAIAARAIPAKIHFRPPAYISEHLSVILSVTNLEGIPIDIRFSNIQKEEDACNVLNMHSGFLHYQFKEQNLDLDYPAEVIREETKHHLAVAAMATGAFPFGLASRRIVVKKIFFDEFKNRLKQNSNIDVNLTIEQDSDYVFTAVDGGTINNEPIGTTVRILNCKQERYHPGDENYLVLIDPFPTITNPSQRTPYQEPGQYSLLQQAKKLLRVLRNQSMFKQEDLLKGLEMEQNRFLIYPTKRRFYFLACGLIGGFSGFLKKAFRVHDYQLGRKNCQTFLRYYFGEPVAAFEEKAGTVLSQEQLAQWCYDANFGKEGVGKLKKVPLIPDMLMLHDKTEIETPVYDGLSTKEMQVLKERIRVRLTAIVDKNYSLLVDQGRQVHRLVGWGLRLFPGWVKRKITRPAMAKIEAYLDQTFRPQEVKQDQLLTQYADIIETHGQLYQKTTVVHAEKAGAGVKVVSITASGEEAWNVTDEGDYIVQNQTTMQEKYIVKAMQFEKRYVYSGNGNQYMPTNATVYALQLTRESIIRYGLDGFLRLFEKPEQPFYIEAPWAESQRVLLDDYLVCLVEKNEVYRIGRQEFEQTYVLVGAVPAEQS